MVQSKTFCDSEALNNWANKNSIMANHIVAVIAHGSQTEVLYDLAPRKKKKDVVENHQYYHYDNNPYITLTNSTPFVTGTS